MINKQEKIFIDDYNEFKDAVRSAASKFFYDNKDFILQGRKFGDEGTNLGKWVAFDHLIISPEIMVSADGISVDAVHVTRFYDHEADALVHENRLIGPIKWDE